MRWFVESSESIRPVRTHVAMLTRSGGPGTSWSIAGDPVRAGSAASGKDPSRQCMARERVVARLTSSPDTPVEGALDRRQPGEVQFLTRLPPARVKRLLALTVRGRACSERALPRVGAVRALEAAGSRFASVSASRPRASRTARRSRARQRASRRRRGPLRSPEDLPDPFSDNLASAIGAFVFDMDDALDLHRRPARRMLSSRDRYLKNFQATIRDADLVLCGNAELVSRVHTDAPRSCRRR